MYMGIKLQDSNINSALNKGQWAWVWSEIILSVEEYANNYTDLQLLWTSTLTE